MFRTENKEIIQHAIIVPFLMAVKESLPLHQKAPSPDVVGVNMLTNGRLSCAKLSG